MTYIAELVDEIWFTAWTTMIVILPHDELLGKDYRAYAEICICSAKSVYQELSSEGYACA